MASLIARYGTSAASLTAFTISALPASNRQKQRERAGTKVLPRYRTGEPEAVSLRLASPSAYCSADQCFSLSPGRLRSTM